MRESALTYHFVNLEKQSKVLQVKNMIKLVSKDMNAVRSPLRKDHSPMRGVQITNLCQARNTSQERMKVSQSPTSHKRIKIRVVSPLRKDADLNTTKENSPTHYVRTCNNSPTCSPPKISYGPIMTNRPIQKPNLNEVSNISIKQHFQPQMNETHRRPPPKYSNFVIMDSHHPSIRQKNHPQRISINNKTFDLGTIKSQIIYVAPFRHFKNTSKDGSISGHSQDMLTNEGSWAPNQPSIQEEVESESLKGSSKSQQSQPQQAQQEIQEKVHKEMEYINTCASQEVCISELVFAQRGQDDKNIPRVFNFQDIPLHQSRMESENKLALPITTQKTLINQLNFHTDKRLSTSIKRDAASVQTEHVEQPIEIENKSKLSRFAITKNLEYQIEARIEINAERKVIEEVKEVEEVQQDIVQGQSVEVEKYIKHPELEAVIPEEKCQGTKEEALIDEAKEQTQSHPSIHINLQPSISNTQNNIPSASSIISLKEEANLLKQADKAQITQETDQQAKSTQSKRSNLQKEPVSLKQFSKKAEQTSTFSTRSIKENSDGFKKAGSKRSITNNIYR